VTTDQLNRLLDDMEEANAAALVISPHLDDAVLSCGALLAHLAPRHPVTVATVFTAAAPPPWSLPARRALRELGRADAEDLFAERREEDRDVLTELGAEAVNLGFRDALFRRGRRGPAYPTYRFDAARGRVASCDTGLAAEVSARVDEIVRAREAARELGQASRIVYYSDFPYSLKAEPEAGFVRRAGLAPYPWHVGRAENANRIAGYRTQFAGLFRDGTVPIRPEIYWLPANDSTTAV
jgi:LmbE family N-acetylglucosaminyl deacetylase